VYPSPVRRPDQAQHPAADRAWSRARRGEIRPPDWRPLAVL